MGRNGGKDQVFPLLILYDWVGKEIIMRDALNKCLSLKGLGFTLCKMSRLEDSTSLGVEGESVTSAATTVSLKRAWSASNSCILEGSW